MDKFNYFLLNSWGIVYQLVVSVYINTDKDSIYELGGNGKFWALHVIYINIYIYIYITESFKTLTIFQVSTIFK